mmetsp:Transcript_11866/g.37701  ORF Transcript_11866/g.37701 Transcript_11866/m.37701 type:complete len:217 (+) Transcript_11866:143-793(+)
MCDVLRVWVGWVRGRPQAHAQGRTDPCSPPGRLDLGAPDGAGQIPPSFPTQAGWCWAGPPWLTRVRLPPGRVQVESPNGNVLYNQRAMTSGQYAFTANEQGDYKVCFTARDMPTARQTKIRLDWKTGVAATDWDAIAKKENLDAMGTELKRLEETVKEIHAEMLYMKKREEEMRDMNEDTNSRVLWFSIGSLGICIGMGVWQLFYLKSFFQRKKLL